MVVPGRVEALPLRPEDGRVELGVEDPLLVVERAGEVRAAGAEDRRAAAADRADARRAGGGAGSRPGRRPRAGSGTARSRTRATRGRCGRASPATRRRRRRSRRCRARRPTRRARSARAACSSPSRSARRCRPSGVGIARRPSPSPWPQTSRSWFVGTSLRCRAASEPSGRVREERVVERRRPLRVELGDAGHDPDAVLPRERRRCGPRPRPGPRPTRGRAARTPRSRRARPSPPAPWPTPRTGTPG